jgi:pimeloyl-ACP methyl ester carboxylesterase
MDSVATLPIVIIPGIQGHWEWMRPAIEALRSGGGQVSTFSLNEEDGTGDPFDQWMVKIDQLIDAAASHRVVLIGVSFGGLVAARYAARHPQRVAALVLVSTPSPRMRLGRFEHLLIRHPLATLPLFALRGVSRLAPEVIAAKSSWPARISFAMSYGWQVMAKPVAPRTMARWAQAWQATDLVSECERLTMPTHVITGEPQLDRVVPVRSTLDYLTLIPGATAARLAHTGHVGLVSRPHDFSALVGEFLNAVDDSRSRRSA